MTIPTLTKESIDRFVFAGLVGFGARAADVNAEASFEDLGVDSLDVTELGTAVKRELGIDVSPRDFEEAELVKDALEVIYGKAGL